MQVRAKATRNMDYLDSAAMYCNIPLALSLDLASDVRDDGIQYRAGLHQASRFPSLHHIFGLLCLPMPAEAVSGYKNEISSQPQSKPFHSYPLASTV